MTKYGLLAASLVLSGCAMAPAGGTGPAGPQTTEVHLDLVRGMLRQEQYYAALAHIEELRRQGRGDPQTLRLLRGQTLQQIGRLDDASADFRALLGGVHAGEALHGLGLIAARSDLRSAVRHLNAAVALRPTDATLRNDLGYTLMMAGRLAEARHHLATAAELDPADSRAASNLIVCYLLGGDEPGAAQLARQLGVDGQGMSALWREVGILRQVIRTRAAEFESAAN